MMLTQTDADTLLAMANTFANRAAISIPPGTNQIRGLIGSDPKERFLLDFWRGTFRLSKIRYQTRARQVVILARLCIDGAPHTNPDGTRLLGSHLHVYREGYDDKWAQPLDAIRFPNPTDIVQTFQNFCDFCNIQDLPRFQAGFV
jgi:hypothetical protein